MRMQFCREAIVDLQNRPAWLNRPLTWHNAINLLFVTHVIPHFAVLTVFLRYFHSRWITSRCYRIAVLKTKM